MIKWTPMYPPPMLRNKAPSKLKPCIAFNKACDLKSTRLSSSHFQSMVGTLDMLRTDWIFHYASGWRPSPPFVHGSAVQIYLVLSYFALLCFTEVALKKKQIERKTLHQRKDYSSLYCGGLAPNPQYLYMSVYGGLLIVDTSETLDEQTQLTFFLHNLCAMR